MTKSTKSTQDLDAALAEFTDSVLAGTKSVLASASDEELRALEETVMRLDKAFPNQSLDEKMINRMEKDFKARARNIKPPATRSIWRSQQTRQRIILAFAATFVLVIFFVAPFLWSGTGGVQGTAGLQTGNIALLVLLGGVIVFLVWLGRRK